jgi:hypothetical protein
VLWTWHLSEDDIVDTEAPELAFPQPHLQALVEPRGSVLTLRCWNHWYNSFLLRVLFFCREVHAPSGSEFLAGKSTRLSRSFESSNFHSSLGVVS